MRKSLPVLLCTGFLLTLCAVTANARLQYKFAIDKLDAETEAEKSLQMKVKVDKCNHCHDKKDKKIRTAYGMKLHDALGGGDRKKYKFDKKLWKRGAGGKYSPQAIKLLRDAIKAAATKK